MKVSKELNIGIFVVTIIAASFILINYLRGKDIFDREIEIYARYKNVEGLTSSSPVYVRGFKAGTVTAVSYDDASDDFIVTCSVLREFRIPADSRMTIYGVDIMGSKGVRIDPGTSDESIYDGGELMSSSEPALLDGIAAGVTPLFEKLGKTLDSLNMTVASVNRIINDGNVENTLALLERTMSDVSAISANLEDNSDELDRFIDNMITLSEKLDVMACKANTAIDEVSSLVTSVDEDDIQNVVASFRTLLDKINDPDGTIGRLINEDSVYNSIDELLSDIDTLVAKIQENPKKYIKISVF